MLTFLALIWGHATRLAPWLFRHGSSAAFDLALGIGVLLAVGLVCTLMATWSAVTQLRRERMRRSL